MKELGRKKSATGKTDGIVNKDILTFLLSVMDAEIKKLCMVLSKTQNTFFYPNQKQYTEPYIMLSCLGSLINVMVLISLSTAE